MKRRTAAESGVVVECPRHMHHLASARALFEERNAGLYILRFGLAAVFLWFGYSQLTNAADWIGWVPAWATSFLPVSAETIVLANGSFEIAGGVLLALGIYVRPAALLLALHLAIITLDIGFNEIGVRDFGLMMATLSLVFLAKPKSAHAPMGPAAPQQ